MISVFLSSLILGSTPAQALSVEVIEEQLERKVSDDDYFDPHLLAKVIAEESEMDGIDPLLVLSVISVESNFRPSAVSKVGAIGMMQLMPKTFEKVMGDEPGSIWNPYINVKAGIRYLSLLHSQFHESKVALVAYNAGPHQAHVFRVQGFFPERFLSYPKSVQKKKEIFKKKIQNLQDSPRKESSDVFSF